MVNLRNSTEIEINDNENELEEIEEEEDTETNKTYCPICNVELNEENISNAHFNDDFICISCIQAINEYYGGEKSQEKVYLDDLQRIVNNHYNFDEWYTLQKKYETKIAQHFKLIEEIEMQYSVAINQPSIINKYTEACLNLCAKDILLAPTLIEFWEKESKITNSGLELPHYPSFEKAAKLFEKLNKYDLAINVCIRALNLGLNKDSSKGGLKGRLARLLKKFNKQHNTNWQYDFDENIIYDDNTGEVTKNFEQNALLTKNKIIDFKE